MTARPGAIEASTERAPFRRIAGVAIVAVVLLVEVALAAAWVQLRAERDSLAQADSLSIAFTDTHRQFQQLAFLAVTEPRFDTTAADTDLALLQRQLSVASTRLDDPATRPQLAADIRALLAAQADLVALQQDDPTDLATARELAERGQLAARSAVDRTAADTRQLFLEDALAAERTANVVAAVAALLLVAGAALVWAVLRRYQRSFDEAWRLARERQQALVATNEHLAALADTRERFVSVLSHELRSPLAVIGAAGETLHHHGDRLDAATRSGILQSLRRQVARQQRLIDDLLLVARHANTEPDPQQSEVDVADLLALIEHDDVLDGVDATVEVEGRPSARVDEHHLEQIVHNLVRNAEKYGGGRIRITAREQADEVVITVDDDGAGVPAELRETLFEPYTQGDGRSHDGLGLGLSITRQLVEANGGTITYRDGELGGATFELRLPRVHVPAGPVNGANGVNDRSGE